MLKYKLGKNEKKNNQQTNKLTNEDLRVKHEKSTTAGTCRKKNSKRTTSDDNESTSVTVKSRTECRH